MLIIQKTTKKYCSSQPSLPRVYKFKKNILLNDLFIGLKQLDYKIKMQIMNYQGTIIGLVVENTNNVQSNNLFNT